MSLRLGVRKRTKFGQSNREKREKESERGPSSDRAIVKVRRGVRIRVQFGQSKREKEKRSPNKGSVRTEQA